MWPFQSVAKKRKNEAQPGVDAMKRGDAVSEEVFDFVVERTRYLSDVDVYTMLEKLASMKQAKRTLELLETAEHYGMTFQQANRERWYKLCCSITSDQVALEFANHVYDDKIPNMFFVRYIDEAKDEHEVGQGLFPSVVRNQSENTRELVALKLAARGWFNALIEHYGEDEPFPKHIAQSCLRAMWPDDDSLLSTVDREKLLALANLSVDAQDWSCATALVKVIAERRRPADENDGEVAVCENCACYEALEILLPGLMWEAEYTLKAPEPLIVQGTDDDEGDENTHS